MMMRTKQSPEMLEAARASSTRIAFATVQYETVTSGPGTFAKYIQDIVHKESFGEVVFLSEDIQNSAHPTENNIPHTSSPSILGGALFRSYKYFKAIQKAHRHLAFDLIWFNSVPYIGLVTAKYTRDVPVVLMLSDYSNAVCRFPLSRWKDFGIVKSTVRSIWRILEKRSLRLSDAVVVNSRYLERLCYDLYDLPESKVHILYKAVDTDMFTFQPKASIDRPVRVLFIKSDYKLGGLSDLITALSGLAIDTELTIAGPNESTHSEITRMIRRAGYEGGIQLRGRVSRENVVELFRQNDILCVPSYAEALGVVFLEALASGVPAIGSNVGCIPEVLDDGQAGWLVPSGNVAELQRAIMDVVNFPEERMRKIVKGRRHARNYSVDAMSSRFKEIVQHVSRSN